MNLSLIIPVKNEENQINLTLNKLNSFKKKIKNIEVIFINDFSDDKTEHLIKSFSKKKKFIRCYKNKKKGLGLLLN